jgi:hypothetical protein
MALNTNLKKAREMKIMVRNEKMKRINFMCVLILALFLIKANLCYGYPYTIDGKLSDWGIDLSAAISIGYLDSHLLSGGLDIDVITEDNASNYQYNPYHYVLESSIPLNDLGLNADSFHSLTIHWTQQCGNDYLNLDADVNPVPEPSTLLLLGFGLICVGLYGWRRKKK